MLNVTRLILPASIERMMVEHARREVPNECCGLLAGITDDEIGSISHAFVIANDDASPASYATNARDLMTAMRCCRSLGLRELAFYHSHPTSEPIPSLRDLDGNTYGETIAHAIICLRGNEAVIRAWLLSSIAYREIQLVVGTDR